MRPSWLIAGIVTIAGLDILVLSGGPLTVPALVAAFALLAAGIARLQGAHPALRRRPVTFDRSEATAAMRWPIDYAAAGTIGVAAFVLSFVGYGRPDGSSCWTLGKISHCGIFDELYFARAGEEYLQNLRIYENTHPPLSKLLVTLSMMLFGGMPPGHGDNPYGWRFLDVVFGALAIVVLYAFGKRITGSTLFASIAAVLLSLDGMHFVQSRIATPEGFVVFFSTGATYALYRFWLASGRGQRSARGWLVLFSVALGCVVSTKWYGVMGFGVSFIVLFLLWRERRSFTIPRTLATIVFVSAAVYFAVWIPDLVRQSPDPGEIHSFDDVLSRQALMFEYHDTLRASHPYASKWWEWPLDYVPVAYFYEDRRANTADPNGCCVYEITTLPNPAVLWFGLVSVPIVGWLGIARRHKGYVLIVLTYLMQWLPWMESPRITFAYHFYVDVPLVCLCDAIALQRLWEWGRGLPFPYAKLLSGLAPGAYVAVVALVFAFFYPILSAHGLTWAAWHERMWFQTWIIGPG